MSDNPYASPPSIEREPAPRRDFRMAATVGFGLTMPLPLLLVWDFLAQRGLAPPIPVVEFWLEMAIGLLVLWSTTAGAVLGAIALRSSRPRLAAAALLLGAGETFLVYYVKFHPWLMWLAQ